MGVEVIKMESYYEYGDSFPFSYYPKQVLDLACKVISPLLNNPDIAAVSHVVVATTCPDSVAPSTGQTINAQYSPVFSKAHFIDLVQGCAGGVSALILGSQLAAINNTLVMVVLTDAARKAGDPEGENIKTFGNGSFACLINGNNSSKGLIHHKAMQFKDLLEVVKVSLGHDADALLLKESDINTRPRKYLGLIMDNDMAIKLLKNAEAFYQDFIAEAGSKPDIMILHQVNSRVIKYLKVVFSKEPVEFVDVSDIAGNCGVASVGIALTHVKQPLENKKVFIGSFGTGGVITAGMWQF